MQMPSLERHAKTIFARSLLGYILLYGLLYYLTFDAVHILQRETTGAGADKLKVALCAEQSCDALEDVRLFPLPRSSTLQLNAKVRSNRPISTRLLQQRYRAYQKTLPWRVRRYLAQELVLTQAPPSQATPSSTHTHSKQKNRP